MPEFDKYVPGTPCWVDVATTDAEAAREFYGQLFGWEFDIGGPESGFYTNCLLRGHRVAGLMELTPEMKGGGLPPAWTTYLKSDDVDDTATRITEAGGQITTPPMDVTADGRVLVGIDATGAVIGFWQPGTHQGAGLANEPNAFAWNELQTTKVEEAKAFYAAVAGWETELMPGDGPPYLVANIGGEPVAGIMDMAQMAPGSPSFFLTYFNVVDCDTAVARVSELGGSVRVARVESPQGPFGVVADPFGATFAVISEPVA